MLKTTQILLRTPVKELNQAQEYSFPRLLCQKAFGYTLSLDTHLQFGRTKRRTGHYLCDQLWAGAQEEAEVSRFFGLLLKVTHANATG
jgi:hypothetical protein